MQAEFVEWCGSTMAGIHAACESGKGCVCGVCHVCAPVLYRCVGCVMSVHLYPIIVWGVSCLCTCTLSLCCLFTGLLGANFCQALLDMAGYKDPIARGLATAGEGGGLCTTAFGWMCVKGSSLGCC